MQRQSPGAELPHQVRNDRVIFAPPRAWLERAKHFWLAGFVLVAAAAAVVLGSLLAREEKAQEPALALARAERTASMPLPRLWQVPDFEFVSQRNEPVSARSLRGHVWIASFFFATCRGICPTLTARLSLVQRRLADPSLRFVSFSVDPKNDTPAVLAAYAARFRPNEPRWLLLSTDAAKLAQLTRGMHVAEADERAGSAASAHSGLFFLIDADGWVRGVYDPSSEQDGIEALEQGTQALHAAAPASLAAADGATLYRELGCDGCHSDTRLAPSLKGLGRRNVALTEGASVPADDEVYVKESILAPQAKIVPGYADTMPSYEPELNHDDLEQLARYVSRL